MINRIYMIVTSFILFILFIPSERNALDMIYRIYMIVTSFILFILFIPSETNALDIIYRIYEIILFILSTRLKTGFVHPVRDKCFRHDLQD